MLEITQALQCQRLEWLSIPIIAISANKHLIGF